MKNFFHTIPFLVFCIISCTTVSAQQDQMDKNMPIIKVVSAIDIAEKVDGKLMRSSTLDVTYGPGGGAVPHRHPGAVYGYVLEGALEFKVEGKPLQTLRAGDAFYEPTMILHEIGRNLSDTSKVRFIAVIVHPRDAKQLVIPENTDKTED
ncbi:cupin domain-containing protein [Sinomicrobium weinanense]|uniref:Cupin domain-containing protein n=1 Tax=Sinomicrobium weinanense TaxID=2842200 RepID=A0A926JSD7_9FLAO|nr:cupin domain-containing protein [Sinomicrobium weinanense]MBC9796635.1 cupin domain-containing protein [Sinomicrobium weinanense]MBU3123841.1 cupin domain-containing protein [Sinomicrobium weinanense]